MEDNKLIKYESGQLAKVSNAIAVTNKILDLAKAEPLLIPYRKGNKWGFCREDKTIVIDCVYDEAEPFIENEAKVSVIIPSYNPFVIEKNTFYINNKGNIIKTIITNNYEFYCNEKGNRILPCKYDEVIKLSNNLAKVRLLNKWGLINNERVEIVPCKYDYINDFDDGFAKVRINDKYGLIDTNGKEIVSCKYKNISKFYEGLAAVDFGFINKDGIEVIKGFSTTPKKTFNNYARFSNGIANVFNDEGICCYINKEGKVIIPIIYESISPFSEGLACVYKDGKCGVININGDVIIPFKFHYIFYYNNEGAFHNGHAAVMVEEKYGFINRNGEFITPCIFENVDNFSNGLARVILNNKSGFINTKGEIQIECKYDINNLYNWTVLDLRFSNKLAKVILNGKWGYINEKGIEFWED